MAGVDRQLSRRQREFGYAAWKSSVGWNGAASAPQWELAETGWDAGRKSL